MVIVLALIVAFLWGYSEIEQKKALEKYSVFHLVLYKYIFQILAYLIFIIIFDIKSFTRFDLGIYKFLLPFILIWLIGNIIYNYCLKNGKLSLVSPILASDPVFIVIIGLILFQEKQNVFDLIALIIICISICGLNFTNDLKHKKTKKTAIFLASLYAFLIAIATTLEKSIYLSGYTITDMFFHYLLLLIILVLILFIIIKIKEQKVLKPNSNVLKTVIATNAGNLLYSYLVSTAYISLVTPLTGLYSVVTQVLAKLFLKEKLALTQRIFVLLIIIATLILLIF
ncbi:MAG: DMT family transporter [Bacilli bacterium]|nr:DMT family transporter [Bacilli bacterium]